MYKNNNSEDSPYVERLSATIVNNTKHTLFLNKKELVWGRWEYQPATTIKANTQSLFSCVGLIFSGVEGTVEYLIGDGSFKFYWDVPILGDITYKLSKIDPNEVYEITLTKIHKDTTLTIVETK